MPVAEPLPTFEPFGHLVSSDATCAAVHDFRFLPPNLMFLSKCTMVELVANAGSPGFGCVISSMLSFTFFGFVLVPFVVGLTDAFMAVVGVTAWAMPTTQSAVAATTAMRINLRMDSPGGDICAAFVQRTACTTHPGQE